MNYQDYIKTELLILIPVLYFIGIALKKSAIPDKRIPIILGIISILLSAIWLFATTNIYDAKDIATATFTAITQGILIAGASVINSKTSIDQTVYIFESYSYRKSCCLIISRLSYTLTPTTSLPMIAIRTSAMSRLDEFATSRDKILSN